MKKIAFALLCSSLTTLSFADVVRVTNASTGTPYSGNVEGVSDDGRYILTAMTSTPQQYAVIDWEKKTTKYVSIGNNNQLSTTSVYKAILSHDGKSVFFGTSRNGIYINGTSTNTGRAIFKRDLETGVTSIVSTRADGVIATTNATIWPTFVSADNQYLFFRAYDTDLVANDTNQRDDVFRKNLITGEVIKVSGGINDTQANGGAGGAFSCANPNIVVFSSLASNLVDNNYDNNNTGDVFLRDLSTGQTTLISKNNSGIIGNGSSSLAGISSDCRYIVFNSAANNFTANDVNGVIDVFRYDTKMGNLELVSTETDMNNSMEFLSNTAPSNNSISSNGRYIPILVGDGVRKVFVKDMQEGTRINYGMPQANSPAALSNMTYATSNSYNAFILPNEPKLFFSTVDGLVPSDTNNLVDVYISNGNSNNNAICLNYGN